MHWNTCESNSKKGNWIIFLIEIFNQIFKQNLYVVSWNEELLVSNLNTLSGVEF